MGKSGKGSTVYHTQSDEIYEVSLEDLLNPVPTPKEVVVGHVLKHLLFGIKLSLQ